jgi:signal transduction histidine kinase
MTADASLVPPLVSAEAGMAVEHAAELHARVLRCPASWIADHHGRATMERTIRAAGLDPSVIDSSAWISSAQLDAFLRGLRELAGDDDTFREACTYQLLEAYGFIRYVFASLTPSLVLKLAANSMTLVSSIHSAEVLEEDRNHVRFSVKSAHRDKETRLMCLSRQAQSGATPTLFGLPAASVTEHSCMARGDDACVYDYRFYTRSRWFFWLLGLAAGLLAMLASSAVTAVAGELWLAVPLLGALLGALAESQRTSDGNLAHGLAIQKAMRDIAALEAEAHREINDLRQRERRWAGLMEEQVAERTRTLQDVVTRVRSIGAARATNLRGLSHDLRNPLSVLRANNAFVKMSIDGDAELAEALHDNDAAIHKMEAMLRDLVGAAQTDASLVRITPEVIAVEPLVELLRRRTRALVLGRDIRVSVFRTREAPETLETDPLVLERVMDNLCTNAAKYTDQGSIVIELDGTPEHLVVKVSDTGRGIESERMHRIFQSLGSGPDARSAQSLGVGLSVVVQLLRQIGGRLEVMSRPGSGSTFWVHFPISVKERIPRDNAVDGIADVVTLRELSEHR